MYADFVLDIWVEVGIVIVTVVVTIMGLRRTLRKARENTELRMHATVEAAKLRQKQSTSGSGSRPGAQAEEKEEKSPNTKVVS